MRNPSTLALLAALTGQDEADAEDKPARTLPLPTAQVAELQLIHSLTNRSRVFYRGDFVRFIHRAGPIADKYRDKVVFMYWDELEIGSDLWKLHTAVMSESEKATIPSPDCLLAHFSGSGDFAVQIADSSMLESYTPQD